MDYFTLLQLNREPFSNAPDPDLFFPSLAHHDCMQKVELAVRLKRGLNVVTGDVGTGKTTLCRTLIRTLAEDGRIRTHLFLDPAFPSPVEFLSALAGAFAGAPSPETDESALKEQVKNSLFKECAEKDYTHLVIIDEGQKLPGFALEILRELLNYETNEHKLLQIVIFAQPEFEQIIVQRENFKDRINLFYRLGPLNFRETVGFIRFRISKASAGKSALTFTLPALWRIYRLTGGYPRKIIHLCHQALLALIIQNKTRVTAPLVTAAARRTTGAIFVEQAPVAPLVAGILVGLVLIAGGLFLFSQDRPGGDESLGGEIRQAPTAAAQPEETAPIETQPAPETPLPDGPVAGQPPATEGPAEVSPAPVVKTAPQAAVEVSPEPETRAAPMAAVDVTPEPAVEMTTAQVPPAADAALLPVRIIRPRFFKPSIVKLPETSPGEESRDSSPPAPVNSSQGDA
ncbi:MAG: AAA family ATPase [Thermodesulfobacteriota bacterium]